MAHRYRIAMVLRVERLRESARFLISDPTPPVRVTRLQGRYQHVRGRTPGEERY